MFLSSIFVSQMLNMQAQADARILKSNDADNDELVAVMKEVRSLLKVKRDTHGHFSFEDGEECTHTPYSHTDYIPTDSSGRSYSLPQYWLPKAEYAFVIQIIKDIHMALYEGKQYGKIHLPTKEGYFYYSFEIHEYGEYNIYDKSSK